MIKPLSIQFLLFGWLFLANPFIAFCQEVPIVDFSIDTNQQAQIKVNSSIDKYYILKMRHDINASFDLAVSMTMGNADSTILTESLKNYPQAHYQVLEYSIDSPFDTDNDGIDDVVEFQNRPNQNPLNFASPVSSDDGEIIVETQNQFDALAVNRIVVNWSEFLNGKSFVKYIITDFYSDSPKVYFINTNNHSLHENFATVLGFDHLADNVKKGQISYHDNMEADNGNLGVYAFNYSNGHGQDFEIVQRTQELLALNMPFLQNNLSYYITDNNEDQYEDELAIYEASRIPVLYEEDVYAAVDYMGLNRTEGYGFFRQMNLDEIPGIKDIVLYESLPNSIPHVAGLMTSVIQTPLSHVNLRALQNNIPNAYIKNPLEIDSIVDLLNHYIYFRVDNDGYHIREANLQEVNDWFETLRPIEVQFPPLNLDYKSILPLDDITFNMYNGYGAKCTNLATMRTFGFPEETIPNGYGVPFYFYQEFMLYNDFFTEIETIISQPDFQEDRNIRSEMLKNFRKKIQQADLPSWMYDELADLQQSFPVGTSIRCRSSSNSEDLPSFNGAGLYTSKTQHPHEGHIAKSIKQVYASLWNLRAYEEREFYKVNHFSTSMGVLCHPNFSEERANGVGVSIDPLYDTEHSFYLNTQIGEELITNPDATTVPEEILLNQFPTNEEDSYVLIQNSNLVENDSLLMTTMFLSQMRDYLSVIHEEFALLYNANANSNFAMDIEYKITSDNQLTIKQARPWASFKIAENNYFNQANLVLFPNPVQEFVMVKCDDCN